jgi:DNA-binding response OmpR family regulator
VRSERPNSINTPAGAPGHKTVENLSDNGRMLQKTMKIQIALLSESQDILEKCEEHFPVGEIILFKSIESVKREDFLILLIDYGMFGSADGVQFLLSKIRKKIHDKPVIMIVPEQSVSQLKADWFFDEFVIHPFRKGELASRISGLLWKKGVGEDSITIARLKINFKEYSVYLENERLDVTYKEFELLRLLVQNRGEVFSRKDLLSKIWGMEYIGGTRTVDVHIRRLRGKLGDEFNTIIETVRNVGYRCRV